MSVVCRFVEWYLDYTDNADAIPSWVSKHAQACAACRRQSELSKELRTMTKQAFSQIPSEPFGGFKPLSLRASSRQMPSGFVISPGLWLGSLVAAVVLAVVGTDYSQREMFITPPASAVKSVTESQASVAAQPYGIFDMKQLLALIPDRLAPDEAQAAHDAQHARAARTNLARKAYLVSVPVMPVRSRAIDKQLIASALIMSAPSPTEQQDSIRGNHPALTLRSASVQPAAIYAKSSMDMNETSSSAAVAPAAGGTSLPGVTSMRVADSARSSVAMTAVPMESRGIPTESGLSL